MARFELRAVDAEGYTKHRVLTPLEGFLESSSEGREWVLQTLQRGTGAGKAS